MRTMLFVGLLAASAAAQGPICVSGIVRPVNGPTICMQGETHFLEDTRVYLKSSTIDLNLYLGQLVRVEGRDIGVTCDVLEVTQVTNPYATLTWCGSSSPGCQVKLKVGPGAIGRFALWAGFGPAYQPLGCASGGLVDGTLLLAPPQVTLAFGTFSGPFGEVVLAIPMNAALVGLQLYFQGARQDIGPVGPVQFTNAEAMRLSPFMPPCAPINC